MGYIKFLLLATLITNTLGGQSRDPKVLVYDITERKGEKPQVKLLAVHDLRTSENDREIRGNQQYSGHGQQQNWVEQELNRNQKSRSQSSDWERALRNLLNNVNEHLTTQDQQNANVDNRDSSYEPQNKDSSYEQANRILKNVVRQNLHLSGVHDLQSQLQNRYSNYDQQNTHDKYWSYELQNPNNEHRLWKKWNDKRDKQSRSQQQQYQSRSHKNRGFVNRYYQNSHTEGRQDRDSLSQQRWRSNKNSYSQGSGNDWRSRSKNSNWKNSRNQKNRYINSPKVRYSEDYAGTTDEFEVRDGLPLTLLGSGLDKREKREAERLSIIDNLKSLVKKLQYLDGGNVAQLYGRVQTGKGSNLNPNDFPDETRYENKKK